MRLITGPHIVKRIESYKTLADARQIIENNLGLKVSVQFKTEFMTTYFVTEGPTLVQEITVSVNRLTGEIKARIAY